MPLWKKLWILFSVIWIVVAALQVATILTLADPVGWSPTARAASARGP